MITLLNTFQVYGVEKPPRRLPFTVYYIFPPLSLLLQSLLEGRLHYEGSVHGYSGQLLDQTRVLMAGCDFTTIELLRIRGLALVRHVNLCTCHTVKLWICVPPLCVCVCVCVCVHVCVHSLIITNHRGCVEVFVFCDFRRVVSLWLRLRSWTASTMTSDRRVERYVHVGGWAGEDVWCYSIVHTYVQPRCMYTQWLYCVPSYTHQVCPTHYACVCVEV